MPRELITVQVGQCGNQVREVLLAPVGALISVAEGPTVRPPVVARTVGLFLGFKQRRNVAVLCCHLLQPMLVCFCVVCFLIVLRLVCGGAASFSVVGRADRMALLGPGAARACQGAHA